jgi:YD repeat-containing protein
MHLCNATYTNNNAGEIKGISYSDTTPTIKFAFDRRGQITGVTNGSSITTITYNDAGQVVGESRDGLAVTNAYDSLLRLTAIGYSSASANPSQYGYDAASRLLGVTNGYNSAAYNYIANSRLMQDIQFKTNGALHMKSERQYDNLNRLKTLAHTGGSGAMLRSFNYDYNPLNQRTNVVIGPENSAWRHGYDALGQVISSKKYWADNSPVAGQQFEFDFDDIGNRLWSKMGGDTNGNNLRVAYYTNNLLNQITSRGVPGTNDVIGIAHANATVTINDQSPSRKGEYYRVKVAVIGFSVTCQVIQKPKYQLAY